MGDKSYHELLEEEQAEAESIACMEEQARMREAKKLAAEEGKGNMGTIASSRILSPEEARERGKNAFYRNLDEKAGKPERLPHSELNPDAGVTGKGMIKTAAEESLELFKKRYRQLEDCTNAACSKGNYDANEYMRGMANGLILARAILDGGEPEYIPAPDSVATKEDPLFKEGYSAGLNDRKLESKKRATQDWMDDISIMQQSVVLSAIRGMDGMQKFHNAKHAIRFYRRCVLVSAFDGKPLLNPYEEGGGSFTGPWPTNWSESLVQDAFMNSRDEMPLHYYGHFMHGSQIIGYKHPDRFARSFFNRLYVRMVHALHLWPESEVEMDKRLSDDPAGWEEREDPSACCSD